VNVRLLGAAQADVIDAADWYERQSVGLGDRFFAAVDRTVERIGWSPRSGWRVQRAPRGREIRETVVSGFPFLLAYEITTNEIVVLSVTHGRRTLRPWRGRL
jgi:plasmid stabilization system protein ParE